MAADGKAKLLRGAERYVLQGKVQQAIGEYQKIIKFDPNDVLILNTIGDLFLRQGKASEANKYFSQVAESYVRNNFFLKAIAVYKKILNTDPHNLEINSTVASLYAKQNLNIDARHQYIRIAAILEKEGRNQELMETYGKIVELDPMNTAIQLKLAESYLKEGAKEKAHCHFAGAARAQAKTGDITGAVESYGRAIRLDPIDADVLKDFLECCLKMGNAASALDHLKNSLDMAPDNLDIREMLGRAYLASNNPETAAKTFQAVFSMNQSRTQGFFAVAQALVDLHEYDQAASCLDPIVPILISRRETERAANIYKLILQSCPLHLTALTKLASIYSATDEQVLYMETLDKLAECHLSKQNPVEALEILEKILRLDPESERHRNLHRQAFAEAFPDTPYVPPAVPQKSQTGSAIPVSHKDAAEVGLGPSPEIVEADLLLNYGMGEKAMSLLRNLETRNPSDKDARIRLLAMLKEEEKFSEAAEQCLLLAILYRKSKNDDAADKYLVEAKQLSPELAAKEPDLDELARLHGIPLEAATGALVGTGGTKMAAEVDLSGDLLEIFFKGEQGTALFDEPEPQTNLDAITEGYPQTVRPRAPAESMQEQLQEVDFYIRLGFYDEAQAKLDEVAKISPDNPELLPRYRKLGEMDQLSTKQSAIIETGEHNPAEPLPANPPESLNIFDELRVDEALGGFGENPAPEVRAEPPAKPEIPASSAADLGHAVSWNSQLQQLPDSGPSEPVDANPPANEMFADLIAEMSSLADRENTQEDFEEHFSLGTAYRDMDLMEEAIKEFQIAVKDLDPSKDANKIIQCCGMLSTCFLRKGMPRSAVRWCQTGLSVADVSSHEAMALRYDMGVAHSMAGKNEWALECFDQIFSVDPSYRDVAQRIDELRACR